MFCISRSADEAAETGLSSSCGSSPRPSRIDVLQWRGSGGELPQSVQGERVCFIPFFLRGVGFPIHPFLRGLLEYYGLQLHSFTPASILHIAGYVALCELFLGCEVHFDLWRKLFRLVPRNKGGQYSKWEEPKCGVSPGPDTCPACRRRLPKSGLPNVSILTTLLFLTQSEWAYPNFQACR